MKYLFYCRVVKYLLHRKSFGKEVLSNGTKSSYKLGKNKRSIPHDDLGQDNQIKLPNDSGAVNYKFGENGAVESITSDNKIENVVADQYSYDQYGNMTKKVSKDGTTINTMRWIS